MMATLFLLLLRLRLRRVVQLQGEVAMVWWVRGDAALLRGGMRRKGRLSVPGANTNTDHRYPPLPPLFFLS